MCLLWTCLLASKCHIACPCSPKRIPCTEEETESHSKVVCPHHMTHRLVTGTRNLIPLPQGVLFSCPDPASEALLICVIKNRRQQCSERLKAVETVWTFGIQMFHFINICLFSFVFLLLSVFHPLEHKLDNPGAWKHHCGKSFAIPLPVPTILPWFELILEAPASSTNTATWLGCLFIKPDKSRSCFCTFQSPIDLGGM